MANGARPGSGVLRRDGDLLRRGSSLVWMPTVRERLPSALRGLSVSLPKCLDLGGGHAWIRASASASTTYCAPAPAAARTGQGDVKEVVVSVHMQDGTPQHWLRLGLPGFDQTIGLTEVTTALRWAS